MQKRYRDIIKEIKKYCEECNKCYEETQALMENNAIHIDRSGCSNNVRELSEKAMIELKDLRDIIGREKGWKITEIIASCCACNGAKKSIVNKIDNINIS